MTNAASIARGALALSSSARLTALLFLVFLILFLVGILVPQTPLATSGQIENFARDWPTMAASASTTGLDDVYHSVWMYAVFALFVLQIAVYLARRASLLWSDPWLSSTAAPQDLPSTCEVSAPRDALRAVAVALAHARYRIREQPGRLVAARNRRSPLWGLAFHASLVVLLLGGWIVRVSAVHGVVLVTEGQVFRGQQEEYASLDPPAASGDRLPRVGFTVESIDPVFGDRGNATDISVRLGLEDGSVDEMGVNRPLAIGGADVLVRNFGLAPVFSVWECRGDARRRVDMFSPRLICWSPGLPPDRFRLLHPEAAVVAQFWPDFVDGPNGPGSASMNLQNPVLGLEVQRADDEAPLPEQRLQVGEAMRIGDFELRLEQLRTWGEFLVTRQAGTILLLGFAMMVAGAAMRLFFPRRLIIAELRESGGGERLVIGGRGEFFPVGFQWEFDALMARLIGGHGTPDGSRLHLEVTMDRIDAVFYWVALGLYSAGWLSSVAGRLFRRPKLDTVGAWALLGGFAAHTAAIVARWILTGHGPVMRDFENCLAGGWVIAGVALLVALRRPVFRPLLCSAIPVAILLLGYAITLPSDLEALPPTLKTPWLYIHVTFAWISFGTFTAAACAAAAFLVRAARAGGTANETLVALDELQFRLIAYGFVASAVMLASGSLWAKILWGSYWGWDPVETWSLAAFVVYGLYMHLRLIFKWRMRRAAWLALFAVIPVMVSFWGVGMMMTSRHLFDLMDMVR